MSFLDLSSKINILNESGISASDYNYNDYIRDIFLIETSMYNIINECADNMSKSSIQSLTEGVTIDSEDIKNANNKMNKDLCELWEKSNDNFISFVTNKCDSTHKILSEYMELIGKLNMDLNKGPRYKTNEISIPSGLMFADLKKIKITKNTSKEIRSELIDNLIGKESKFNSIRPSIMLDNINNADKYINNKKNEYIKFVKKPSNISGTDGKYSFKSTKNITDSDIHTYNEILRIKTIEYKELCYAIAKYAKYSYDALKDLNKRSKNVNDFITFND